MDDYSLMDRGADNPRDTRAYAGPARRVLWGAQRFVERKLAYSLGDVMTYEVRLRAHAEDDSQRDVYRAHLDREKAWLNCVWKPLGRLLRIGLIDTDLDVNYDGVVPGDRVVAKFFNDNPHLSHSSTGAAGTWLEWYSIMPAPWSGQREDWLLWITEEGEILLDGPLNPLQAQAAYESFDQEVRAYYAAMKEQQTCSRPFCRSCLDEADFAMAQGLTAEEYDDDDLLPGERYIEYPDIV